MRFIASAVAMIGLCSLALSQPWPWPTEDQNSVHQINNNYGAYQEFSGAPYCHDGVDIPMAPGDGIFSVTTGRIINFVGVSNKLAWKMAYCMAIKYNWSDEKKAKLDGGPNYRRYSTLYSAAETLDHLFAYGHYDPWSLNPNIASAYLSKEGLTSYTHGAHEKLAEVVEWINDNSHLHYSVFENPLERNRLNPVKYLSPDPALPPCGIQFDPNPDRAITFRYAEDEGDSAAAYFPVVIVPEGGDDVEYALLWGKADVVSRCWDRYQLTEEQWKLAPYQVGISIEAENPETGEMEIVVPYSPLVVFDGPVADNPAAFWGERAQMGASTPLSQEYSNVVYEDDATNNSDGGPPEVPEFSFILTNQDGVLDADGRPVIELSDADRYWDTDGKAGDAWNDNDETAAHEAASQAEALFPDQGYTVTCVAKDHQGREATYSRRVLVDNFAPYVKRIKARFEREGMRDDIVVYEAEWVNGTLDVLDREPGRPIQGDVLWCEVWFSEAMRDEGIVVKLLGGSAIPSYTLTEESLESDEFENDHWTGRVTMTTWDSLRNMLAGKLWISVRAYDKAGHGLDCVPATPAKRTDREGGWSGYEDAEGNPTTTGDVDHKNHWFEIEPWVDLAIGADHSGSVYRFWSGGAIYAPHHLLDLMMAEHTASGRADRYRASVHRYWAAPGTQGTTVQLMHALSSNLASVQNVLGMLYQMGAANYCSNQLAPLEELQAYTEGMYSRPRRLLFMSDLQVNSGPYVGTQEAGWGTVVADTTGGSETIVYAVMSDETRAVEPGMEQAIRNSGGACLSVPPGELYQDPVVSEWLYRLIQDDAVRYQLRSTAPSARESYSFTVDPAMTSILVLGIWTDWGMQMAQEEQWCWHTGRGDEGACCDEASGEVEAGEGLGPRDTRDSGERRTDSGWGGVRATFQLYDPSMTVVPATDTLGTNVLWHVAVDSAETGEWTLTVSGGVPFSARVAAQSAVRLELAGRRGVAAGEEAEVKVRMAGSAVTSSDWALVGEDGRVYDETLALYDDGAHGDDGAGDRVWATTYTFPDSGSFRVMARWNENGYAYERVTASAIRVFGAPWLEFVEPDGAADSTGSYFWITWEDGGDLSATIALYYDDDNEGADGILIAEGIQEDSPVDSLKWTVFGVPQGDYYVYAEIEDGMNPAEIAYSAHPVTVTAGCQTGWPVAVGGRIEAPICAYDLDGNGTTELLVGASDSLLYCFSSDGTSYHANFPFDCEGKLTTSCAVGDADGDGLPEIAVACLDTGLVWLLSETGVAEPGWPVSLGAGSSFGSMGGVTLGDLTGDGYPEIIWANKEDSVYVYTGAGGRVSGWPQYLGADHQYSSAGIADVDGDTANEVLIPSCDALICFEADGTVKWSFDPPATGYIWTSPAIGDVTGDGQQEVAFATYWFNANSSRLYLLDAETGGEMPGWAGGKPIGRNVNASVAIGYLDAENGLRAVVATGDGEVRAFTGSGTQVYNKTLSGYGIESSPLISDLDGDQSMEIVAGCRNRVMVLEATTGDTISAYCRGVGSAMKSTCALADLDNDGDLELCAAELDSVIHVWDVPGSISSDLQEWPQFQRDAARTGLYRESVAPLAPEMVSLMVVAPDSLKLTWSTVGTDVYGRPHYVSKYLIYRGDEPCETDWTTLAGEVASPDTTFTERPGTVGDPTLSSYYRVRAEDQHGNESALSAETVGEFERNTGAAAAKEKAGATRR